MADEQLNPAESYAWRKWTGYLPSEPRRKKKRQKKKLPRAPRPRQGCRRLCDHQRQVPAVRIPVMMQRQVPTVHSFVLPVQFLDMVLDMPVVVRRQVPGLMVQKTVVRPQLPSIYGRRHSLSSSRGSSPMVQAIHHTTEILQLLFDFRWSMSLLCRVVQVLRCCCGEDLGAPTVAARWEICALLRSSVFGSHSFGVCLRSTGFWTFLGDDIRKRSRIQRLLVQHWIHVYVSLRRLLEDFHIFSMSRWTSDPEVEPCLVPQWLREMTSCNFLYSAQCLVRQLLWEMTSCKCSYSVQCSVRHWIYGAASLAQLNCMSSTTLLYLLFASNVAICRASSGFLKHSVIVGSASADGMRHWMPCFGAERRSAWNI